MLHLLHTSTTRYSYSYIHDAFSATTFFFPARSVPGGTLSAPNTSALTPTMPAAPVA